MEIVEKRGGPYPVEIKERRRNEVRRLHFDYGYSASKIASMMRINRNTINSDIKYLYSTILKNSADVFPEATIHTVMQRLEIQRDRIRENLDKTNTLGEKMQLERLLYDIDCKILLSAQKMAESSKRIMEISTAHLNEWMKKKGNPERFISFFDKITVSEEAKEKIDKIIQEDKIHKMDITNNHH